MTENVRGIIGRGGVTPRNQFGTYLKDRDFVNTHASRTVVNKGDTSTQTSIERLGSLQNGKKEVSFLLWLHHLAVCFDSFDTKTLLPYMNVNSPKDSILQALLFSHMDMDHCDRSEMSPRVFIPTYIRALAFPIMKRMGINLHDKYPEIQPLIPYGKYDLRGIGEIVPLPMSHSDITHCGFQVTTEDGKLIFISPDNRSGNLTSKTINHLQSWMEKNHRINIDFLVVDMTRVNLDPPMTFSEQMKRINDAKKLARNGRIPIVLRIKSGDFSQLLLWIHHKILPKSKTYMERGLYDLFKSLAEIEPHWQRVLDSVTPYEDIRQLNTSGEQAVYLTDDPFDHAKVRRRTGHIFLYADTQLNHINHKNTQFSSQIYVSGHDAQSAFDLFDALRPIHWTASHSGGTDYRNGNTQSHRTTPYIDSNEMELKQKGQRFSIPNSEENDIDS